MYRAELPKEGDIVVVKILSVDELGAKCELLEYGGIEGMMPINEYTRKSVRSIKKLIQPGKQEVLCVINVDDDKKYIDLSKKRVTASEIEKANAKYYRNSFVNSIIKHIASSEIDSISVLYDKMCWSMDEEYEDSYAAFEKSAKDNALLDKYDIDGNVKSSLCKIITLRFADQPKTVSTVIEVSCLGPDGVNAIKTALLKVKNHNKDDIKLSVNVVKCPHYSITSKGIDTTTISSLINNALNDVKECIESYPLGQFSIVEQIKIQ